MTTQAHIVAQAHRHVGGTSQSGKDHRVEHGNEMTVKRCELCRKPCIIATSTDLRAVFCPVTGKLASWHQAVTSKQTN